MDPHSISFAEKAVYPLDYLPTILASECANMSQQSAIGRAASNTRHRGFPPALLLSPAVTPTSPEWFGARGARERRVDSFISFRATLSEYRHLFETHLSMHAHVRFDVSKHYQNAGFGSIVASELPLC